MNIYLKNYSRFLFNCKGIVSISDTQKYISNNDFDIDEILSYLQECININDIFNLANSNKFYKGHNLKEKYLLLIQFFNIIHNYSKNLILRYEVYATKSIKKTTSNIIDCLIYIPHYENYLLDLLGYIYDDEKSEWYIDSKISLTGNLLFAATCILCGYAQQKLMKIMEETNFSEGDDNIQTNQSTLLDKENNWNCISCSFSNDCKSVNCEMCFLSRQIEVKERDKPILNNLKKNQWKCSACSFINDIPNEFCNVCNSGRNLSYSISNIPPKATPNKNKQMPVLSEKFTENITLDRNKSKKVGRQTSAEINLIKRQSSNQWKCSYCTFINKKENLNCEACSKLCDPRLTYKRNIYSLENKTNPSKNSPNKIRRCKSEGVLNNRNPDQWSCTKCTYLNKKENLNCEACTQKHYERNSTIHKTFPQNLIKRQSSNQWKCSCCTFINKKENLNCEVCSQKRNERNSTIHKTFPQNTHRNLPKSLTNDIKRSTSDQNLIYQQSHPMSSQENKFITKKVNLNGISSNKSDVKNHSDNSFNQNTQPTSDISKNPTKPTNNNKNNRQHSPSNKQASNIDKRNEIHQNPPIDKNSTKISPKKVCKYCKKVKENKHWICKMKFFLCGLNH